MKKSAQFFCLFYKNTAINNRDAPLFIPASWLSTFCQNLTVVFAKYYFHKEKSCTKIPLLKIFMVTLRHLDNN